MKLYIHFYMPLHWKVSPPLLHTSFLVIMPIVVRVRALFRMYTSFCSILIIADAKSANNCVHVQSICDFMLLLDLLLLSKDMYNMEDMHVKPWSWKFQVCNKIVLVCAFVKLEIMNLNFSSGVYFALADQWHQTDTSVPSYWEMLSVLNLLLLLPAKCLSQDYCAAPSMNCVCALLTFSWDHITVL